MENTFKYVLPLFVALTFSKTCGFVLACHFNGIGHSCWSYCDSNTMSSRGMVVSTITSLTEGHGLGSQPCQGPQALEDVVCAQSAK